MFRSFELKRGDYLILAIIIALALSIWIWFLLPHGDQLTAEIYQNDQLIQSIRLTEQTNQIITLEGEVHNTIELRGKTVRFSQSTCPDQVCVRTGTLTRSGQVAVCLPNRAVVRLVGKSNEVDIVA